MYFKLFTREIRGKRSGKAPGGRFLEVPFIPTIREKARQAPKNPPHKLYGDIRSHSRSGGKRLPVQVGKTDAAVIDQVNWPDAGMHQRLCRIAAYAPNPEHGNAGTGKPGYDLRAV